MTRPFEREPGEVIDMTEYRLNRCASNLFKLVRRVFDDQQPYEHPLDAPLAQVLDWPINPDDNRGPEAA